MRGGRGGGGKEVVCQHRLGMNSSLRAREEKAREKARSTPEGLGAEVNQRVSALNTWGGADVKELASLALSLLQQSPIDSLGRTRDG